MHSCIYVKFVICDNFATSLQLCSGWNCRGIHKKCCGATQCNHLIKKFTWTINQLGQILVPHLRLEWDRPRKESPSLINIRNWCRIYSPKSTDLKKNINTNTYIRDSYQHTFWKMFDKMDLQTVFWFAIDDFCCYITSSASFQQWDTDFSNFALVSLNRVMGRGERKVSSPVRMMKWWTVTLFVSFEKGEKGKQKNKCFCQFFQYRQKINFYYYLKMRKLFHNQK